MSEIAQAITNMNAVTQQAAAHSEETASASRQLAAQAGLLGSVAGELTAIVAWPRAGPGRGPQNRAA